MCKILGFMPPGWGHDADMIHLHVQGLAKRRSPGLVNFVTALANHFRLALSAAFMQPFSQALYIIMRDAQGWLDFCMYGAQLSCVNVVDKASQKL